MNVELIQNLAKMAHSDALAEYRLRMKTEFAGDVIFADIYDQKFSELIVLECIKQYNTDGGQTQWEDDQRVLKHFGVEE